MSQKALKSTKKRELGNTNSSSLQAKSYRNLFFTWNNYTDDDIKSIKAFFESRKNILYVFQQEIGENGTKHLQGCFKSKTSILWDTIKTKFPKCHWERCKSWEDAISYCTKNDTRDPNGSIHTNMTLKKPLIVRYNPDIASEWQQKIISIVKSEPDPRTIYWFCDKKGNTGKTTIAKYLCINYPDEILYLSGKGADIKHGVTEFISSGKTLRCAIFDFPRTVEDYVSYQALEEIKNGIFYSGKYESKMVIFNEPHVIVLANFEPKLESLSADRWNITII